VTARGRPENRPPSDLALLRYQAISAYLSLRPPRGQRTALLRQLAEQTWRLPDGRQVQFAAETLRNWVRRFRRGGIEALEDKPRRRPGVQVLEPEHIDIVCRLKRDVPARSIDRVIRIARSTGVIPKTVPLSRSTVHRVLQANGLSKRKQGAAATDDLDRFEAAFANDLWQSDMLMGPWLPDPDKPGGLDLREWGFRCDEAHRWAPSGPPVARGRNRTRAPRARRTARPPG